MSFKISNSFRTKTCHRLTYAYNDSNKVNTHT